MTLARIHSRQTHLIHVFVVEHVRDLVVGEDKEKERKTPFAADLF
jgi:hypothetical protein